MELFMREILMRILMTDEGDADEDLMTDEENRYGRYSHGRG